jgi:hypothetical protein
MLMIYIFIFFLFCYFHRKVLHEIIFMVKIKSVFCFVWKNCLFFSEIWFVIDFELDKLCFIWQNREYDRGAWEMFLYLVMLLYTLLWNVTFNLPRKRFIYRLGYLLCCGSILAIAAAAIATAIIMNQSSMCCFIFYIWVLFFILNISQNYYYCYDNDCYDDQRYK